MEPGDALLGSDLVEGGTVAQLSLQLVDLSLCLLLNSIDLFPFAFAPDAVQVPEELVDQLRSQVVAVLVSEGVRHGVGFVREPLLSLELKVSLI